MCLGGTLRVHSVTNIAFYYGGDTECSIVIVIKGEVTPKFLVPAPRV